MITDRFKRLLQGKLFSSSLWVVGGTSAIQALRLVSTIVLSRILAPETFGVMALVTTVTGMLQLLSDVGLQGSVNHDPRGDDPTFLNVAWTLQVIRGIGLTLLIFVLAWPLAEFYSEPMLVYYFPVVGTTAFLAGITSSSYMSLTRHLKPQAVVVWQVVAKFISLIAMLGLAWYWQSAWVLVIGAVVEQVVRTAGSFRIMPERKHQFVVDKEIAQSLMRFGRWVWVSTIATWLLGQGDKLIFGRFMTAADLGVYTMATNLTIASTTAIEGLANRVLMPYYAGLIRSDPNALKAKMLKVRGTLVVSVVPVLWMLMLFGQPIVDILYDDRYREAGWMLKVVSAGAVATNVMRSAEQVFLADGDSYRYMLIKVAGGVLFFVGIIGGGALDGTRGMLLGTVAARFAVYVPLAIALRKRGLWLPKLDLFTFGATAAVGWIGYSYLP